jgi:hypothetical protein
MVGGQGLAASPPRGPFTIEGWKAAWNNRSAERVMARIPLITTSDVAGYWPRTTRPVRGPKEYAQRIVDLLNFIPDFRAELIEHATSDDVMFLRWVARGTGPDGRFEAVGAADQFCGFRIYATGRALGVAAAGDFRFSRRASGDC